MLENTGNRWRSDGNSDAAKCEDHEYGIHAWECRVRVFCETPVAAGELQSVGEGGKTWEPFSLLKHGRIANSKIVLRATAAVAKLNNNNNSLHPFDCETFQLGPKPAPLRFSLANCVHTVFPTSSFLGKFSATAVQNEAFKGL